MKSQTRIASDTIKFSLFGCALLASVTPVFSANWTELAETAVPTCEPILDAYKLCLIDDFLVARSDAMLFNKDGPIVQLGGADYFTSIHVVPLGDDMPGLLTQYLQSNDTISNVRDVEYNAPGMIGIKSYSVEWKTQPLVPSSAVVSLFDFSQVGLLVETFFPNPFALPAGSQLNEEQLQIHMAVTTAVIPLNAEWQEPEAK